MISFETKLNLIKFALAGVNSVWLVGGAARVRHGLTDKEAKDFDLIVPTEYTEELYKRILEKCAAEDSHWYFQGYTYFGGLKLKWVDKKDSNEYFDVEVWTGDVGEYLSNVPTAWDGVAINIFNGTVLRTAESLGENKLITTRPTIKTTGKSFVDHCKRQGLAIEERFDIF